MKSPISYYRKYFGLPLKAAVVATLLACSGLSGGGGVPGAAGPGGAVGVSGSSGGGETPPMIGSVAKNNPEGVLSAPADDSFLGDCDPKAILYYGSDYKNVFDTAIQKSVTVNQFDDKPFSDKYNIVSVFGALLKGLQVRVVYIDAAGGNYAYRDFSLNGTAALNEISVEYENPANASRIEVHYIPGVKSTSTDPDAPGCSYPKTENFSESWTHLNAGQFDEMTKKNYKVFLAAFDIALFHRLDRPDLPALDAIAP